MHVKKDIKYTNGDLIYNFFTYRHQKYYSTNPYKILRFLILEKKYYLKRSQSKSIWLLIVLMGLLFYDSGCLYVLIFLSQFHLN